MPIKSYIAHRVSGRSEQCVQQLQAVAGCSVLAAENRDAWIVITDTPSEEAESALAKKLQEIQTISLALVAAFAAPDDLVSLSPVGEAR